MKRTNFLLSLPMIMLATLAVLTTMTVGPASAQSCIPAGSTIDSALFSIYVNYNPFTPPTVSIHRITDQWTESEVTWNNFGGSYDGAVQGSFVADGIGWRSADVTSLVQQWIEGVYPNYGLLLEQGQTHYTIYWSSEYGTVELRPKLEICYTTLAGDSNCLTIQRPGADTGGVADAYIWEHPDYTNHNTGSSTMLFTGLVGDYEKQSLIRFDFEICEQPGEGCTPGFWKNHLDAWGPTGYSPGDDFDTTFSVDLFDPDITLEDAVWAKGGGNKKLARHGTAALLSAAHPDVGYPLSEVEVIAAVQAGDADTLANYNDYGTPGFCD